MLAKALAQEVEERGTPGGEGVAGQVVAQVVGEVAGGGVAAVGLLGEGFEEEGLQLAVHRRGDVARADHVLLGNAADHVQGGAGGVVGELAGEEAEQDHAQGVDVGARVEAVVVTGGLLGGHVGRGAEQAGVGRQGQARLVRQDRLGQAEVHDARLAVGGDQDVRGFQVAVDHAALVRVLHGAAHRLHELEDLHLGELVLVDVVVEAYAVDELHGVVVHALVCAAVVHACDVGVLKSRGELDLALEIGAGLGRGERAGGQELQGDLAVRAQLLGTPDHTHAALAQLARDAVALDLGHALGRG